MLNVKTTTQNSKLINRLIFTTFLLISLGQLSRISFLNQQINFYLFEVVLFFLVFIFFIKYKFNPIREFVKKYDSFILFFGFLIFSFVINFFNYNLRENLAAFLYFFRLLLYFVFFIYLKFYVYKERTKSILTKGFSIFILLTIVLSLIQYFLYPDLRNLFYLGWDPHLYRLFGLFFDTSISGAIFGIILIYLWINKPFKNKLLNSILLIIFFVFTVLTFSRSLYLVLSIIVFLILLRRKTIKFFIFYILFFILFIIIVPKPFGEGVNLMRMFSVESRKESYIQAINLWKKAPIFGIGYNHIRYEKIKTNVHEVNLQNSHAGASFHSSFLIILVCGGIFGLILFCYLLYQLANINYLSFILIIFLSFLSLSDNVILHPFILSLLLSFNSLSDK